MPVKFKDKLIWFLRNLDLQIQDIEIERYGINIDIYFDTVDIQNAVLGMHAFLTPTRSYRKRMGDFIETKVGDTTLVQTLFVSGILGSVKMLPPHQAEFLTLLNMDFGLGKSQAVSDNKVNEFLGQLISSQVLKREISPLVNMNYEDQLLYVRKNVDSAISVFKFVELARGLTWEARLRQYVKDGFLHLDSPTFDYISLSQRDVFVSLRKAFDDKRPGPDKVENNMADAFAACALIELVEKFRKKETKALPLFFISTFLSKEILQSPDIQNLLTLEINGSEYSVLRDADYFIFKGTFRSRLPSVKVSNQESRGDIEELSDLRNKIKEIIEAQEPLAPDSIKKIMVGSRPLLEILQDIRNLTFYEKVWVPYSKVKYTRSLLTEVGEQAKQLQSDEFRKAVEQNLIEVKAALAANVREYKWFSSLWYELESKNNSFIQDYKRGKEKVADPYWEFSLIRFDVPLRGLDKLKELIDSLLSGDEEAEKGTFNYLISIIILFRQGNKVNEDELTATFSILWILELDKQLINLLSPRKKDLPNYLLSMLAASMLRQRNELNTAKSIIDKISDLFQQKGISLTEKGHIAFTLGYLYYRYWMAQGYSPCWRRRPDIHKEIENAQGTGLIERAVEYASFAYNSFGPSDKVRIITLSQYLHYMVEEGNELNLNVMDELAGNLATCKQHKDLWHFRFDNTMARYFHFKAYIAKKSGDKNAWRIMIESAIKHIGDAIQYGWRDKEIEAYQTALSADYSRGFK
jgi:hypothetical protein